MTCMFNLVTQYDLLTELNRSNMTYKLSLLSLKSFLNNLPFAFWLFGG